MHPSIFIYPRYKSFFRYYDLHISPPSVYGLSFHFLSGVLMHTFNFHEVQFISFMGHAFHVQFKNSLPNPDDEDFLLCFFHFIPVSIIVLAVTFKCIVYFELFFNMV